MAGIAAALEAGRRGHHVTLYEAGREIGGQLILAAQVPGKEDYGRAIEGFRRQLADAGIHIRTGSRIEGAALGRENYDEVIVSTGVAPRHLDIPGADDPRVVGYTSILDGSVKAGKRVIVIGAGGIGHDMALTLALGEDHGSQTVAEFERRWGVGGPAVPPKSCRSVTMLKRSPGAFGKTLGKSTGWILRKELKDLGVRQIGEVNYLKIDAEGLHIEVGGQVEVLPADTIVVCAGQTSVAARACPPTADHSFRLQSGFWTLHANVRLIQSCLLAHPYNSLILNNILILLLLMRSRSRCSLSAAAETAFRPISYNRDTT